MANYANGKICYIEIPASEIDRSAEFYQNVFGWETRRRGDEGAGAKSSSHRATTL